MESNKLLKKKYTPSKEELKKAIILKMNELNLWEDRLENQIPSYWDNYNNFVIFSSKYFTDAVWAKAGDSFWEHVSNLFSGKSIALQGKINNDDFRSPNAQVVYGPSQWVVYLDNGIWYTWNVEFTMFCSGNVSERHRVARFNCEGETVVDMFAGIGYFTLPYLVHAKAKHVYACEWNRKSVEALILNLKKNKVADNCTVLEGDVCLKGSPGVADRINLGLIPNCEQFWPTAARILRSSGGTLHVHGNVTSFPSAQTQTSQCEQCKSLLQSLSVNTIDRSIVETLGGFEMKTLDTGAVGVKRLNSDEKCHSKWKKIEWFIWSIHTCHSFCGYLATLTKSVWVVKPLFLHRVKAYAPHVDHLVLDVGCDNSLAPVTLQEPQALPT